MADWFEIKQNFVDWLKKQEDVDFNEGDKDFAPIKYSEKFKLFIEKHDGDENLNMDSFTKANTQKMETDDAKANELEEKKTKEDTDKNNNENLIEDMLKDYIADLKQDDAVFQAIDGLKEKDGKISNAERNMFIEKATLAAFDEDGTNFSFDDLVNSVEKIKKGDVEFLNGVAAQPQAGGDLPGAGDTGDDKPTNKDTVLGNIQKFSELTSKYNMEKMEEPKLNVGEIQDIVVKDFNINSNTTLGELETAKGNVEGQISTAQGNFNAYKEKYTAADGHISQASAYIASNEAEYQKIITEQLASDEQVQAANTQITTLEGVVDETNEALNNQYILKDDLTLGISQAEQKISALEGSLKSVPSDASDETKAAIEAHNENVRTAIAEQQALKRQLAEQLLQVCNEITENKAKLDQANADLQVAYTNMEIAVKNADFSDANAQEIALSVVQNKKVLSQAKADKQSCQAGMVATDSCIQALQSQLNDIEVAIEDKKRKGAEAGKGAKQNNQNDGNTSPDATTAPVNSDTGSSGSTGEEQPKPLEYPANVAGLTQHTITSEVTLDEDGTNPQFKTMIDGKESTLEVTKTENGFSIKNGDRTSTYEGENYEIKTGDKVTYQQTGNDIAITLEDGSTIKIDVNEETGVRTHSTTKDGVTTETRLTETSDSKTVEVIVNGETVEKIVTAKEGDTKKTTTTKTFTDPETKQNYTVETVVEEKDGSIKVNSSTVDANNKEIHSSEEETRTNSDGVVTYYAMKITNNIEETITKTLQELKDDGSTYVETIITDLNENLKASQTTTTNAATNETTVVTVEVKDGKTTTTTTKYDKEGKQIGEPEVTET